MSTLWTPGGEVPVDRSRTRDTPEPAPEPAGSPPPAGPSGAPEEAEMQAQIARMQQLMLERPAAEIIVQHAMGLSELAVLHLSQPEPDLRDARLAIDALAALVDGLEGRLGEAEAVLRQTLPQLRMYFVEVSDAGSSAEDTA